MEGGEFQAADRFGNVWKRGGAFITVIRGVGRRTCADRIEDDQNGFQGSQYCSSESLLSKGAGGGENGVLEWWSIGVVECWGNGGEGWGVQLWAWKKHMH